MSLSFPNSPSTNDTHVTGGSTWIFNGEMWVRQGTRGAQGIQGIQGTHGTQGLQGLQGNQGVQGLQGIIGVQVTAKTYTFTADGQNNKGTFKGYTSSSTISSMYFYSNQGNGLSHNTSSSFSHNTWIHVAWEFDDSADDFRLYIDGVLKETNTSMTFEGGNPTYAYFGRNTDQTNEHIEFYIDNIRWTRGVCRYNGTNFSPPTQPYPTS